MCVGLFLALRSVLLTSESPPPLALQGLHWCSCMRLEIGRTIMTRFIFFSHSISSPCSFVLFIYFRKSFSLYRIYAELQRLLPASCRLGGTDAWTRLWLPGAYILNSKQEAESTNWEWHDHPSLPALIRFRLLSFSWLDFAQMFYACHLTYIKRSTHMPFDLYQVFYTHVIWFILGVSLIMNKT